MCKRPGLTTILNGSVVKLHHKFMLASYMKQIAKFLALLHHNASFLIFASSFSNLIASYLSENALVNACHCLG